MALFTLAIDTGNDAFGNNPMARGAELARILRHAANLLEQAGIGDEDSARKLWDANGNGCGAYRLAGEDSGIPDGA